MKFNKLAGLGIASVVLFSSVGSVIANSGAAEASPAFKRNRTTRVATKANSILASGRFVKQEKATTGRARIVSINGKRYLEFDRTFRSGEGPDVKIILHRNSNIPLNIKEGNYITLAPIKSFRGAQRYAIPENINLADYKSVGIWCEEFNATFGYAPLQSTIATANSIKPIASGNFVKQEKATSGKATIVNINGKNYLEFDRAFSSGEGPDVKIILHRNSNIPLNIKEGNYLTLAPIKSFKGAQRYAIPENVNLADYKSVGIWCEEFNATFGYASLQNV
ncbi:electron transfer protein with DM13 domain [Rivularia sp. PCC 7116]|uniref:DM13 domain-containing protein n=1 Tax=Rivularia sp. PCC 7116 TaxID=373994 RepID=UPI00029EDAE1|nr:DM13 domain-containing protein [Rivularia sp. PCC 7116]AFY54563.1 electron transfer protein with DM13 domain [Rivularia sp. PCC 7116]